MQDQIISFSVGDGPYRVRADAAEIGADLVVKVYGGEKPHVGAVAVAIPRPSLADAGVVSSTVSVITLTGHKEDDLAKMMAGKLSATLNRITVLTAGIHTDNITSEGIKIFEENAVRILEHLLDYFSQRSF